MVRTLNFHCQGCRFHPGWGTKILRQKKRKEKKKLRISYRDPGTGHSNATVTSEGLSLQSQTWSRREVNNYIQRVVNREWR